MYHQSQSSPDGLEDSQKLLVINLRCSPLEVDCNVSEEFCSNRINEPGSESEKWAKSNVSFSSTLLSEGVD